MGERPTVYTTGLRQRADDKYWAEPPPFVGRHLWAYTAVYQVQEPARTELQFDMENLMTLLGPGCWHCGQIWYPTIGSYCPGETENPP